MAINVKKRLQFLRGTTEQNSTFVGLPGELTINTDTWTIRVHDGVTPGGNPAIIIDDIIDAPLEIDGGSAGSFGPDPEPALVDGGGAGSSITGTVDGGSAATNIFETILNGGGA
jgi:hypothetical protein